MEVLTYIAYNWTTAPPAFGDAAITLHSGFVFFTSLGPGGQSVASQRQRRME